MILGSDVLIYKHSLERQKKKLQSSRRVPIIT